MKAEISFDLVMEDDMSFAEGCYRLKGRDWQVFTCWKTRDGRWKPGIKKDMVWRSGVTGVNIILSDNVKLNKKSILEFLTEALEVSDWVEVRGPDSMQLR